MEGFLCLRAMRLMRGSAEGQNGLNISDPQAAEDFFCFGDGPVFVHGVGWNLLGVFGAATTPVSDFLTRTESWQG